MTDEHPAGCHCTGCEDERERRRVIDARNDEWWGSQSSTTLLDNVVQDGEPHHG